MNNLIVLELVEQQLFHTLLDCVHKRQLPVTLRVAGGWVRDKLLGKSSHDIDIAIDHMMGRPFVEQLILHLSDHHQESHGVGVIKSNPDKSKHLETATMQLYGLSVDFVNLRSESYTTNSLPEGLSTTSLSSTASSASRIPTRIEFGTPLQDALRRDITINALFYNLHTGQVEDFSGHGLEDLHNHQIRTPLDPHITLMDDPLRLLRVIRFAARFNYTIVPELLSALHDRQVHDAFRVKVSRERVGMEVDKMVSDVSVKLGMRHLLHEHIYPLIFTHTVTVDGDLLQRVYEEKISLYTADSRLAAYCALMLPLAARDGTEKETPVVRALRDGLKLPNRDYQLISRVVDNVHTVMECRVDDPVAVGRTIITIGPHYRLACILADSYSILFDNTPRVYSTPFLHAAESFQLTECYEWRPILSGDDIKSLFNLGKHDGKQVGVHLKRALDIQLTEPGISRDDLISRLSTI